MEVHKSNNTLAAGKNINEASQVIIMLHGRGAEAETMLGLQGALNLQGFAMVAPQATGNTWYPFGFMVPRQENEPYLTSALDLIKYTVDDLVNKGFAYHQIYLLGFSQGACLTLEYAAQNAQPYGGVMAFIGGLAGEKLERERYKGDFESAPVFISNSDDDPHVPLQRSEETKAVLEELGAQVTLKVYPGMPHTINQQAVDWVNEHILKKS